VTTLQTFDVEHGGFALLTCHNGMRMIIDCGHNATLNWYPLDRLRRLGVQHLEMLVVTNYNQHDVAGCPRDRRVTRATGRSTGRSPSSGTGHFLPITQSHLRRPL
jgi:hypothetical protein